MKKFLLIPTISIATIAPILTSCSPTYEQQVYQVLTFGNEQAIDWSIVPQALVNCYQWVKGGPEYNTFAQMVFVRTSDSNNREFVIRMISYEPEPLVGQAEVYLNSCMEAYLNFGNDNNYFNIEVDLNNDNCQEFGLPWSSGQGRTNIKGSGYECITLTQDWDDFWEIIITIKVSDICYWYGTVGQTIDPSVFTPGYTFSGNFYKICGTKGEHEHYGMWNRIDAADHSFHHPEQFGKLVMV